MTKLKQRKRKTERNKEIVALRKTGVTYKEIAKKYGISVTRVIQILDVWEGRDE